MHPTSFRPSSPLSSIDSKENIRRSSSFSSVTRKGRSKVYSELLPEEEFWRDHQAWLHQSGYRLRPRYHPDWTPSWVETHKDWTRCEDGVTHRAQSLYVMDATQMSDGRFVALKKTSKTKNSRELDILQWFASEGANDSRNHCVPVLRVLDVPDHDDLVIIVMPLLRRFDSPWFNTIGEAVECIKQLFEGVQFMHQNNVAHRDLSRQSVMMDASELYPEGYHPRDIDRSRDYTRRAKHYTRTEKPPKYYLTCFGKATHYSEDGPVFDLPTWGFDKSVPEFCVVPPRPCNPFATDVYYLGNMLKEHFQVTKKGFKFLDELIENMTEDTPARRPTMDEVVRRFDAITKTLKDSKLNSRVVGRYDNVVTDLVEGVPHMAKKLAAKTIVKRVPSLRQR